MPPPIPAAGPLSALLAEPDPEVAWLIEPYVPARGIVFLYGKTSIGKSPLTWKMAQCVAEGLDFFHCPVTHQGRVLYIEVDTPITLVKPRLRLMEPVSPNFWWLNVYPKIDILEPGRDLHTRLTEVQQQFSPTLVIVNTLRKVHSRTDKDSEISSQVYGAFQAYFPDAAILAVHHDKKTFKDPKVQTSDDEAFSGSQAWFNDAQVGLHLVSTGKVEKKVMLVHTKSQVSTLHPPLHLQLTDNGTTWVETGPAAIRVAFATLDPDISVEGRVKQVMVICGCSRRTVYRALEDVNRPPKVEPEPAPPLLHDLTFGRRRKPASEGLVPEGLEPVAFPSNLLIAKD